MSEVHADQRLNEVLAALANEHRRAMVQVLSFRPCAISELATMLELSLPAIHRHIRVMEDAGLVVRKKFGRTNVLGLRRESLQVLQEWVTQFHPYWGSDEETLENYFGNIGD